MKSFYLDTERCAPESEQTLLLQQQQLEKGHRLVQMFPKGTTELSLPSSMSRCENLRGIFHFNPLLISADKIIELSNQGKENEFLNLGPYNKSDIIFRALIGETIFCITEYSVDGIEIRSAAGTSKTISEQKLYFEKTKELGSFVVVGDMPERVLNHLGKG